MDPSEAAGFIAENHRGVLVTQRQSGGLQTSPVTVGIDEVHRVTISSRETAYKVANLRKDPFATLCVFTDRFFGPWIQVEGRAEIVPLPEAMDLLVDYYRRISGEHPNWDEYREVMERDKRCIIRFAIEKAGPTRSG